MSLLMFFMNFEEWLAVKHQFDSLPVLSTSIQ